MGNTCRETWVTHVNEILIDISEVEPADFLVAEEHGEHAVNGGRPHGDVLADEALANEHLNFFVPDVAVAPHLEDVVALVVFNVGQPGGKGACTALVARDGWPLVQRFMRAQQVVGITPPVKGVLARRQAMEPGPVNHFQFEGAVEAFILALRLGMIGDCAQVECPGG